LLENPSTVDLLDEECQQKVTIAVTLLEAIAEKFEDGTVTVTELALIGDSSEKFFRLTSAAGIDVRGLGPLLKNLLEVLRNLETHVKRMKTLRGLLALAPARIGGDTLLTSSAPILLFDDFMAKV
jgi:hypothetical protein